MLDKKIADRVKREQVQHDEDMVLENSYKLKSKFFHVAESPTMKRAQEEEESVFKNVENLRVLDVGCGFGEKSVLVAKNKGNVVGIDIANNYIEASKEHANKNDVDQMCDFYVMDVHDMDFEDNYFDLVVGRGIIHHLDLEVSLTEIKRVLKVGGEAVFFEPLNANPLLKIFRKFTPSARTIDEKPLSIKDLDWIRRNFEIHSLYFGIISAPIAMLTSLVLRPWPNNFILKIADYLEKVINNLSFIQPFNQYVLLKIKKSS